MSAERMAADLRYLDEKLPGTLVVFHDPNFAVKFDQVFDILEAQPPGHRPPYIIESSLTVLRGDRMRRLRDTNCVMVAPGVESWTDYSNKAGMGRAGGMEKVDRVAEHFAQLAENVPYLQANFIFGLDTDRGDEPVEMTKRFMDQTPFVWPTINIPVPFGGTPLHDELAAGGRILEAMPFSFYYAPYLVTTLQNYDPATYYGKLAELYSHAASPDMLRRRMNTTSRRAIRYVHRARTASFRADVASFQRIQDMLRDQIQSPGLPRRERRPAAGLLPAHRRSHAWPVRRTAVHTGSNARSLPPAADPRDTDHRPTVGATSHRSSDWTNSLTGMPVRLFGADTADAPALDVRSLASPANRRRAGSARPSPAPGAPHLGGRLQSPGPVVERAPLTNRMSGRSRMNREDRRTAVAAEQPVPQIPVLVPVVS